MRAVVPQLKKVNTRGIDVRNDINKEPYNVLFLCTGNSARSIMAEVILNRAGQGNFRGFSAGSLPKGQIHPYALDLLRHSHYDVTGLRSKSWKEFRLRKHQSSISFSPFVTMLRKNPVQFGLVSR